MTITDRIQRFVILSSPYLPFRWIYAAIYGAILISLIIRARMTAEITRLELRTPRKGHRFGVSDLDVRAETSHLTTAQYFRLSERLSDILRPSKRWKRILDFYVFGPAEWELQRRLGPISFGDSRMVCLLGSKQSVGDPAQNSTAANAPLCRTMYEYGNLSQQLFEETPTLPFTWTAFRRLKRIDDGFGAKPLALSLDDQRLREDFNRRAAGIEAGARIHQMQNSDIEQLFSLALAEADLLCEDAVSNGLAAGDSIFQPIAKPIPPDNLSNAIDSCAAGVGGLCSRIGKYLHSAMLGCVPAATFEYRLYLILREDLSISQRIEVFRAIREEYASKGSSRRIRGDYLRLRYPMLLTPAIWRATSRWYSAMRPVEEFYFFARHGVVLWGSDPRGELIEPAPIDVIRSAGIAIADLRNLIWEAFHARRLRRVVDILTGRIPALWLLLAQSTIATSVGEALAGCAAAGFPGVEILNQLQTQMLGMLPKNLPPAEDPLWKPALEASSKWIDDIAAMALARLDSNP